MDRFLRTELFLGQENLNKLKNSTVMVVGLGAVGSYAIEALARGGIGKFILFDHDEISRSNINRQIFALESTLGFSKTAVAEQRIHDINPSCQVEIHETFIDKDNVAEILDSSPDFIIDAIDSLQPKIALLSEASSLGLPIVSSMGAALRKDPSQIKTGDILDSSGCALARWIRKHFRRRGIGRGITCVYSTEKVDFDFTQSEKNQDSAVWQGRSRNTLGSLSTIPGIFGLILANEVICRLTEG